MIDRIGNKSEAEGLSESRLPPITTEWQERMKGAFDFLGLNHYVSDIVTTKVYDTSDPGWHTDHDTASEFDPSWPGSGSSWLKMSPYGFRKLLKWIRDNYNNTEVIVTENGFSDDDKIGLQDVRRATYYNNYINQMLKAIKLDGCKVTGYTAWSLMDNFEWAQGYT